MCGIFGFYLKRKLVEKDINEGIKYLKLLNHRGPDDSGYWYDKEKGIFLGHNRLAIIDTSKKNSQPFTDGNAVISYNGEIYNYLDIKRKYKHVFNNFKTSGDTELLIKFWKLKKSEIFDELDGMFAFAIFDENKLTLAVDFFGEKPIYYSSNKDGFYFSSEAEPLIKLLGLKVNNIERNMLEFKIFGYINHPQTGYKDLFKLGPSTIIDVKNDNGKIELNSKKYWVPEERNFSTLKPREITKENIKTIKNILIESIEKRMISDVPIGLFMSSGVDSTLIASLIKNDLGYDIDTYTVEFDQNLIHNESVLASKISRHLNLRHHILKNSKSQGYNISEMINLYSGELNDNPTIFSFYKMSMLAKKSLTVAIGGLGGDEIFLGYNRYNFYYKYLRLIKFLRYFKYLLSFFNHLSIKKISKLNSLCNNLLFVSKKSIYVNYKNLNQLKDLEKKYIDDISSTFFSGNLNLFLNEAARYDLDYTMPNSYIPAMELGSMKASVEIRSPFLNRKLYKYITQNIDQRALIKYGSKFILKSILKSYIPIEYLNQPKRGFVFPIKNIIGDEYKSRNQSKILLRDKIYNLLLNENSIN